MSVQGWFLVVVLPLAFIASFVTGACIGDGAVAIILRLIGGFGILGWLLAAYLMLNAMNTDI